MITFPASLPAPSQEFSIQQASNSTRTSMQSGRIRQRRTSANQAYQASIRWVFTDEEFDTFKGFLEYEAAGGSVWFDAPLFTGGTVKPHRIRLIDGAYSAEYQSWFGWAVTASADIQKIATPSPRLNYLYNLPNALKIANIIDQAVNTDLPNITRGL